MAARPAQRRMQAVAKGKGRLNLFDSKATSDRQTGLSQAAGVGVVEDVARCRAEKMERRRRREERKKIFWWEKGKKRRLGNQRRKSLFFFFIYR